jgi:hypothetical protein
MFKLAIVAAILPAAAWWWTFDLPSASGLAKSAAYTVSRSNDMHELTDIPHWE